VPLAAVVPTSPYIINTYPEGLQQGVLDTDRFVRDWAALSVAADHRKGRCARPHTIPDVQCALDATNIKTTESGSVANNMMLVVHGSLRAIVADVYNVEVVQGVAIISLRWIKALKVTPNFGYHKKQNLRKPHHHHRPIAGCELKIADDITLPSAALRERP
jgi:hypothetical protein